MTSGKRTYRRLPGKKRNWLGTTSLWVGPDHLLSVDLQGFIEVYNRYYYTDIQSILLQPDGRQRRITRIWGAGAILALSLLLVSLAKSAWIWSGLWATATATALLGLLFNWLAGATCTCEIRTPVQNVRLPSVNREKQARKALAELRARIAAVQGRLSSDDLERGMERLSEEKPLLWTRIASEASSGALPLRPASTAVYTLVFSILLVDGVVNGMDVFLNHVALSIASTLTFLALAVATVAALIRKAQERGPQQLGRLLASVIGYLGLVYLESIVASAFDPPAQPDQWRSTWEVFVQHSQRDILASSWVLGIYSILVPAAFCIGILGFIALARWRKEGGVPPRPSDLGSHRTEPPQAAAGLG
ncbi:MAG: hypothetical protein AB1898_24335 [Acidobacteriota bacterium]